jgi:tetratricopeptide (TPR) repeat protein
MKARHVFCFVSVLLILAQASPSPAFFNTDVKKAKDFMAAGMYPQAIELLNKRINDEPTDADAHFVLATAYLQTGNLKGADERFASAVRLKPDYGYQIGGEFKKGGDQALNAGDTSKAEVLYKRAVNYQPNLGAEISKAVYDKGKTQFDQGQFARAKSYFVMANTFSTSRGPEIGTMYFENGKALFEKSQYDQADEMFSTALLFDSSIGQKVGGMYFDKGKAASDEECDTFYRRSAKFSKVHNKQMGDRLLAIAEAHSADLEKEKRYRKLASNYITVPPDFKVYECGEHPIELKAGEMTKHYIKYPLGTYSNIKSPHNKLKFIYPDGKVIEGWKITRMPNEDNYKLQAVEDIKMVLKVTNCK